MCVVVFCFLFLCPHYTHMGRDALKKLLSINSKDNTYHGLCYTRRGALAGTRNSSMGLPHEGSIRRPSVIHEI